MRNPERLSPLQQRTGEAVLVRGRDLDIEERPFVRKLAIRGDARAGSFIAGFRAAFGVEPPRPGHAVEAAAATLLRVGLSEWLAVDRRTGSAGPLAAAGGLVGDVTPAGLRSVDVSSATTILRAFGAGLHRALRRTAPLEIGKLAVGSVARTRMGRLPILVHVLAPDRTDLFVARSYARSFLEQLHDAADFS